MPPGPDLTQNRVACGGSIWYKERTDVWVLEAVVRV